jgi:hypothetical protein
VPTILQLHGIAIPPSMDGRVITEMLVNPGRPILPAAKKETITTKVKTGWGSYELQLELSVMGKYRYVNFAKVKRVFPAAPAARN